MDGDDEQPFFDIGDPIEVYWPDTDQWLPATLESICDDGSMHIVWAEDASKSDVPADYVRSPVNNGGASEPPACTLDVEAEPDVWIEDAAGPPHSGTPAQQPVPVARRAPAEPVSATSVQRSPLKRLRGAQRDLKPAWMTKGLGIGTAMFGEATGEMLKPGMTRKDLEEIERGDRNSGPDPFGDVFCESSSGRAAVAQASHVRQKPAQDGSEMLHANGSENVPVDAEASDGQSVTPVFVHDGGILNFNGTPGAAIDVPYSSLQNPSGSFSVHFWAEPQGGTGYRSPLTSRDLSPQRGYAFFITPSGCWSFWIGLPGCKEWLKVEGPAARTGEWQRLLGVYCDRERAIRLFIDGEKVGERSCPAPIVVTTASGPRAAFGPNTCRPLRLGAGATEGSAKFSFTGAVNDVRVYNRALSQSEAAVTGCDGDDGLPPTKRKR